MKLHSNVERPNFFIAGAPKCGTTSLSRYLKDHPDVFFSHPKEPTFFCTDFADEYRRFHDLETYLNICFYGSKGFKARGEGTVWYMFSEVAIDNILKEIPDAKFIILLRNPLEMAPAMHATELFGTNEEIESFEEAWNAMPDRKAGKRIPEKCKEPKILQYGDVCTIGAQLERLLTKVKRENVLILLHDDFKKDSRAIYVKALEFLSLEDDGKTDFPRHNSNRRTKNRALARVIRTINRNHTILKVKKMIGLPLGKGPMLMLKQMNTVVEKRLPLSPEMKGILIDYFQEDIERLSKLINRDLSHWTT